MQLSSVDINLLPVLHAFLSEHSVARASRRVGLSASAASHALARLRTLLDDPLLVRAGRRLIPTPRAEQLREPVRLAVERLEEVFRAPRPIDPRTLKRAFRVATTDHLQFVVLRRADRLLAKEAPRVDLYALPLQRGTVEELRAGSIDLTMGVFDSPPPDIHRQALFRDRLVTVARRGHPARRRKLTLAAFAELPHVLVAPNGTPHGLVDTLLENKGLRRRVARTLPTFVDAAFLVAGSDYVASFPETVIRPLRGILDLAVLDVPVELPSFTMAMIWHRRDDADVGHTWFRKILSRASPGARRSAEA